VPCQGCILIVDDDPGVREALACCFATLGCTAITAADGIDALEQLKSSPRPCLMLVDMNMPRLDGDGFARASCERSCPHPVPIITMSAGRDRPVASMVQAHLDKPFDFEVLTPSIERFCQDPDWLHGAR
jgi:two-component system, chemotaxis family, chemotaxis protein CheY